MRILQLRFALILSILCAVTANAQQRPLLTEDVDIIPPGSLRIQVGVDFMQNAKVPVSGLTGDLTRVGVVGFNVGLAPNVELIDHLAHIRHLRRQLVRLLLLPGSFH